MIDKLDLRLPASADLRWSVRDFVRPLPIAGVSHNVRHSKHYAGVSDLRSLGIDALLHLSCRYGKRDHKLEIFDVGKKAYSQIAAIVEAVTEAAPGELGIIRIDCAADVAGIPVSWFREHAQFRFKQTEREFGEIKYGVIGRGKVETIMAGARPNPIRIYDKVAESKMQFRKMRRHESTDAEPLEFAKEFGFKETDILTRIERQCGGKGIPLELKEFSSLSRVVEFNPFQNLRIISSSSARLPTPEECTGLDYFTGMGMHYKCLELGMQEFRKLLNRQTNGNGARTMERYGQFFPSNCGIRITAEEIYEIFRQSAQRQLAA